MNRFLLSFPLICIPFLFGWIWIQFTWILIQLFINWIGIQFTNVNSFQIQYSTLKWLWSERIPIPGLLPSPMMQQMNECQSLLMSAIGSDAKHYPSVLESERSWICETSSDCRRSWVALHLITVSVEMGFSKFSFIQLKTSHVHVYSVSRSVICKPFIGEKLYICQAWVVIDLHNKDLTTLSDLCVSPLSTAAAGDLSRACEDMYEI